MKKISKLGFLLLGLIFFIACQKEENKIMLNSDAKIESSLSVDKIVLEKDKAEEKVLMVTWEMKNVEVPLSLSYIINFKNGDKKVTKSAQKSPLELTGAELNKLLLDLGVSSNVATDVQVEVIASLSEYSKISAQVNTLNATAYNDVPDLSTSWGIVGTINGWSAPDVPFMKVEGDEDYYVAHIVVEEDGEIKFRKDEKWEEDYGDDGADNTLESGGANITVKKGKYKVLWNTSDNTYVISEEQDLSTSWGIVGTINGWNAPDVPFMKVEGDEDYYVAHIVVEEDGEIKFRKDEKWEEDYGDDGADNTLESGGANITVKKGKYKVLWNISDNTYAISEIN